VRKGEGLKPRRRRLRWVVLWGLATSGLALGVFGAALHGGTGVAQAQPPAISVFPIPGSRLAAPQTQITFRGMPAAQLGTITVTGSKTGAHTGQVKSDSDNDGGSFIPAQPFDPGETVTVNTKLNVLGGKSGSFQFQVANPAGPAHAGPPGFVPNVRGGVWRFRSRPDLAPAAVTITHGAGAGGSSDIFVAPQYGPVQNGVEILDPRGQLVWFNPAPKGDMDMNPQVQTYQGRPVLTWWQGYSAAGMGTGEDLIYNTSYQPVATVQAGNGLSADLHEFQITRQNTALITAYYPVYWNATSVHGLKQEIVFDCVIQEIDIPTGLVLFQWDSLDHVPIGASYMPVPAQGPKIGYRNPWDYFHLNSIQLEGDGNLLVSARNTWAVYKLDHRTGSILWTLGGKQSSFRMEPGASFAFQHDARSHAAGDKYISVFDDGAGGPVVHKDSRALELYLDFQHHVAHVYKQWHHSPALLAYFEGNVEQLPGLDEMVGWGQQPFFTEYDQRGRVVLDGRFVSNTASYRAFRFPWTGTPTTPPAVAASSSATRITWYASWNGATAVSSWRVLEGSSPTALQPVASARKTSFETAIQAPKAAYAQIVALDAHGHQLGASSLINVR
jgi:hypothetical protein